MPPPPSTQRRCMHAHQCTPTPTPATLKCCMYFFSYFSCLAVTPCATLSLNTTQRTHAHAYALSLPSNVVCLFFLCLTVTPMPPPPSTQHNACMPTPMPATLKCGMSVFFSCFSCLTATPPSIQRQYTHARTHTHPHAHCPQLLTCTRPCRGCTPAPARPCTPTHSCHRMPLHAHTHAHCP